jgi:hypothetical protein
MEPNQGTEETLQANLENPQIETTSQEEEATLTDEQKEELIVDQETQKIVEKDDPPGVQKRINQAIRKWRSEERNRLKAEKEGSETKAVLEEMRKHNEKLYDAIQRQTNATETLVDVQTEKVQQDASNQEITGIQERIAYLKDARIKARQDMDYSREAVLDDQIDTLKEQLIAKKNVVPQQKQKQSADQKYEQSIISDWISDTSWFSPIVEGETNPVYNSRMERAAREYDLYLCGMEKWKGVPIKERLKEVKSKVEEKFGYKATKGVTRLSTIESTKGLPPPKKDNAPSLSDDQKYVAHRLFANMTQAAAEKVYADELKIMGGK